MSDKYAKSFVMYKPRRSGDGSASQWSIASNRECMFLEMSNQTGKDKNGNATFAWADKIIFKLGEGDIGELLAVIAGVKRGVGPLDTNKGKHKGLFHTNDKGNSVLYFARDQNTNCLNIFLSTKKGDEKTIAKHTITDGEACVLGTLLRRAIEIMYKWD